MSTQVGFFIGSPDGMLGHFLSAPLTDFQAWYRAENAEFPGEFQPEAVELLDALLRDGASVLSRLGSGRAVDLMLADYYGLYADGKSNGQNRLLEFADESFIRLSRYRDAILCKENKVPLETLRLLEHIFTGRPVLRSADEQMFYSEDSIFRLSYWTLQESKEIADSLSNLQFEEETLVLRNIRAAVNRAAERKTGIIIIVG